MPPLAQRRGRSLLHCDQSQYSTGRPPAHRLSG